MSEVYPHPIKAVIFDNDGTILDTIPVYYRVLEHFVPPPYPDEVVHRVNGASDIDACKIFIEAFHMDYTPEALFAERQKLLNQWLPSSPLIPHVESVIKKIHNEYNVPMIVATGSMRVIHDVKTSGHPDIFNLFQAQVCGDDVKTAKPSPDIFLKAMEIIKEKKFISNGEKLRPENVLVIEDALNGIIAANEAKMPSVFVNDEVETFGKMFDEKKAYPNFAIKSFKDFPFDKFKWGSD